MRLRFTIRDLLWLATLVALAVGWWLDHEQHLAYEAQLGHELNQTKNSLRISEGELEQRYKRRPSEWIEEIPNVNPPYQR